MPPDALAPLPAWRPGPTARDPKPAWARHQLHDLVAARLAGHPVDLSSWWRAHRADPGAWASTHAVAARVPAMVLLGHRDALWAHADHLRRHPSRFSSAGNHRVAELAALALARRCLPDLPAPGPLRPTLARQLHPDGWPREQSLPYLAYVLEWGLLAHRCGEDLADLLHRGAGPLEACLAADGRPFAIGDDGGDVVLPGRGDEASHAHDVLGCIRSALGQPAPRWKPSLRATLLGLGPTAEASPPPSTSFPDGGFTVLRSSRLVVGFDHGPLGMPPLDAHGHDDLLAVWAHRDGQPWLVGRGTHAYHDPQIRSRERGPWGTCGLVLDGRARALPHRHPFLWRQTAEAHLERLRLDPQGGEVVAHHEAWAGLRHTRTVTVDGANLDVHDHLQGHGVRHVALAWHLAPGLRGRTDGDDRYALESPLPVRVMSSDHAESYGRTVPADTLMVEGVVRLPARLITRWRPR